MDQVRDPIKQLREGWVGFGLPAGRRAERARLSPGEWL